MTNNTPHPQSLNSASPHSLPISTEELAQFHAHAGVAARMGGEVLRAMLGKAKTWSKGPGDWVTAADFESQQVIREYLLSHYSDHQFLGEEDEGIEATTDNGRKISDFCWIVDPLDGTTNFVHQLPGFAVSIGLRFQDTLIVGCIYDPLTDEMFGAIIGHGATMNDALIRVSTCTQLDAALLVFSMNSRLPRTDPQTLRLLNVLEQAHTVRRLGSAALNFCLLAAGKIDGYWATNLKTWDIAAGWLIATEAGATLDSFDDQPLNLNDPQFCCTATPELFEQLQPLLDEKK